MKSLHLVSLVAAAIALFAHGALDARNLGASATDVTIDAADWWETGMAFALGYMRGIIPCARRGNRQPSRARE